MTGLDQKTAERLAKMCGMFGSDSDGERANAARLANDLVKGAGLSWFDVIRPQRPSPPPPPQPPQDVWNEFRKSFNDGFVDSSLTDDLFWSYKLDFCRANINKLSEREANFIATLVTWSGRPTNKQMKWLNDIYNRLVFR